eukprot:772361_1
MSSEAKDVEMEKYEQNPDNLKRKVPESDSLHNQHPRSKRKVDESLNGKRQSDIKIVRQLPSSSHVQSYVTKNSPKPSKMAELPTLSTTPPSTHSLSLRNPPVAPREKEMLLSAPTSLIQPKVSAPVTAMTSSASPNSNDITPSTPTLTKTTSSKVFNQSDYVSSTPSNVEIVLSDPGKTSNSSKLNRNKSNNLPLSLSTSSTDKITSESMLSNTNSESISTSSGKYYDSTSSAKLGSEVISNSFSSKPESASSSNIKPASSRGKTENISQSRLSSRIKPVSSRGKTENISQSRPSRSTKYDPTSSPFDFTPTANNESSSSSDKIESILSSSTCKSGSLPPNSKLKSSPANFKPKSTSSKSAKPKRPLWISRHTAVIDAAREKMRSLADKPNDLVDLSGDSGVLKRVRTKGSGDGFPTLGSVVAIRYVGRLSDGTHVSSADSADLPFKFVLGRGDVILAWELAISCMKKSELATVICDSAYGYGAYGIPDRIPPNAALNFRIELVAWSGDKSCAKCSKSTVKPQRCSRCKSVWYCGQNCQAADWKHHRKYCGGASPWAY